jgi:hypothetical protein
LQKPIFFAFAAFAALALSMPAYASPITYDLTLEQTGGNITASGTGDFTINGPVSLTGFDAFDEALGNLTALDFTIAGNSFNLSDDPGAAVLFSSGSLIVVAYAGTDDPSLQIALGTGNLAFNYLDSANGDNSFGLIEYALAPVPEPGTLAVLASGLLGIGFFFRRRKKAI